MTPLVDVCDLHVSFNPPAGSVRAVRGVSLQVNEGEILGVVGESGCGKTVLFRALLGLLPASAAVSGTLRFAGELMPIDGALQDAAALVYQNPGAALNPVFTIGRQMEIVAGTRDSEVLCSLLHQAGLAGPERLLGSFPHEFSGGMKQRAVIALALAQDPRLLIADEPTTALDVTTQAQILDLFADLRRKRRLAVVLISHDLAAIRRVCDRVVVLYAGRVVESGDADQVLDRPTHPYTRALLESVPRPEAAGGNLVSIPGSVPDGREAIVGCAFAPRCRDVNENCHGRQPSLRQVQRGHDAACVLVESST